MAHNPQDLLDTILGRLKSLASTETVIGEPVKIDNMTLLPVIKLSVGFVAGGGEGSAAKDNSSPASGVGGGGGGGASVNPVGFICWDGENVKFISVGKGNIETLVQSIPDVLKKFGISLPNLSSKSNSKDDNEDSTNEDDD